MSKDARDRLYAVVGIGYDGPDLIPNIDYRQSDNEIARDFTRSLIRRNGCFDIITADRSRDFRSDGLPSWSPNWLSGNLPSDEHFQECTRPRSSSDGLPTGSPNWLLGNSPRDEHFDEYLRPDEPTRTRPLLLSHEFRQRCLDGHPNTLVTEGLLIGTTDRMTSAINEGSNLENIGSGFGRSQTGSGDKSMEYYGGSKKLLTGLLRCLLIRKEDWWQVKSCEYGDSLVWFVLENPYWRRSLFNKIRIRLLRDIIRQAPFSSTDNLHAAHMIYLQWFNRNAHFLISNKPLARWVDETALMRWTLCLFTITYFWWCFLFVSLYLLSAGGFVFFMAKGDGPSERWMAMFIYVLPFVLAYLSFYFLNGGSRESKRERNVFASNILFASKHSGKLVLCDTGMLAMSSQYSEIGDHICLLAGCATPVVVRRKPGGSPWVDPQRRVYEVVGSALMSLSERDREPLLAFIGDRERLRPFYYQFYEAENGLS
ncbi:hypothetical protein F5Y08DRAFT_29770 [Xylaria arbuscula]|nr:hypothetical protein F5Y08DRAFT_29770 [Xylaria arbuscula]